MQTNPLTELRSKLGWSQMRLAEELGVNQSTVSRLERRGSVPRVIRLALERLEKPATDNARAA